MNDRIEIVMDDRIEIGAWASVDDSEGNLGSYLNCGELGFETYAPGDVLLGRFTDQDELIRALEGYRESQSNGGAAEFAWEPDPDLLRDLLLEREADLEIERQSAQLPPRPNNGGASTVGEEPDLEPEPPPQPDRAQLAAFIPVVFKHASTGVYVSMRSFRHNNKPFRIATIKLNGYFTGLINLAYQEAELAAHAHEKVVFCPPVATFTNAQHATEKDLAEGLVLSIECDTHPRAALAKLIALLGPPTVVVESGGGGPIPRPARSNRSCTSTTACSYRHAARASTISSSWRAGSRPSSSAVMSNVPLVHPIRWPGSLHRKGVPKLCQHHRA